MINILIVEDERINSWDLQETLDALGYQIVGVTSSGEHAIDLAFATQPHVVLMDVGLNTEEIDNTTASVRIQQELGIPVVYLSADTNDYPSKHDVATQSMRYLTQPLNAIELRTAIETAVQRYRLNLQNDDGQQWFLATLNSLGEGAIATDTVGRIQFMNPLAEELTGWTASDAIEYTATDILKFVDPDTRTPIPDLFTQSMVQHDRVALPNRCILIARNGKERYISGSVAPILTQQHDLLGSVLAFQDITERVNFEQATRRRAEHEKLLRMTTQRMRQSLKLNEILNTTVTEVRELLGVERVVIYQFNPDLSGNVIAESLSQGIASMKGILLTDPCLILEPFISKYRQHHVQVLDNVHEANLAPCYVDLLDRFDIKANLVVSITADDTMPWGLLSAQQCSSPRHWTDGEISVLSQLSAQISVAISQSHSYQTLQQTSQALSVQVKERTSQLQTSIQYETLLSRIIEKVWQNLDEQQIIQAAAQELCNHLNAKFCNIAFYPSPDVIGCDETSVVGEYCQESCELEGFTLTFSDFPGLWEQLRQGQFAHMCVTVPPIADQQQFCVLIYPMYDNNQVLLGDLLLLRDAEQAFSEEAIHIVRQVTKQCAIAIRQSRLYQAAHSQVEELGRLNQLKDDFLSTVSHELRTPMANLRMATQMLEICLNRLGIMGNEQQNVEKYFKILKDEGQREINLIEDLLNLSRLDAGIEGLNPILVDLKLWVVHSAETFSELARRRNQTLSVNLPETLPLIEADLSCLERLVKELLTNACKYTPAGEYIRISATLQATWLDLHVTNTGVEIPASELSQVFKKFYRIPNSDRWKHGGTGLGLALAQKLADVLGGYLLVTSAQNETTFTLRLPLPATPLLII